MRVPNSGLVTLIKHACVCRIKDSGCLRPWNFGPTLTCHASEWISTSTQQTYALVPYTIVLWASAVCTHQFHWLVFVSVHDSCSGMPGRVRDRDSCSGMPGRAYLPLPPNRPSPAMHIYWLDLRQVATNKDQEMVWYSVWKSQWRLEWWKRQCW